MSRQLPASAPPLIFDRKAKKWRFTLVGCDFYFQNRDRALGFIEAFGEQAKCLYQDCWEIGFEDALGPGFRFCPEHARAFHRIHNNPLRGEYAQAG